MPETVGDARLLLGEGPVWDQRLQQIYCVDIEGHKLVRLDPAKGDFSFHKCPRLPAALGLCRSGRLVVGKKDGVFLTDFDTGKTEFLGNPIEHRRDARLNDGKVAPDGSFWVGSMQNNVADDGSSIEISSNVGGIFRIDVNGGVEQITEETLGIANTLAWTPDQADFIFADSLANTIYRAEYQNGCCGTPTVFNDDFERGVPDGSAMDADGYLWNCRWGGGCVVRFAPNGSVDCVVDLPATNITSCAFGGRDGKTLFVTSARSGLTEDEIELNPLEGAVFSIETAVSGLEQFLFGD